MAWDNACKIAASSGEIKNAKIVKFILARFILGFEHISFSFRSRLVYIHGYIDFG